EAHGLELPTLTDATVAELRSFLPPEASVANPVDMIASATPEQYLKATRALLADERVDALIVIFIPPLITDPETVAKAIVEWASGAGNKTVLANFMSAKGAPDILSRIPTYAFPEAAAAALGKVTSYGEWRQRPLGTAPAFGDIRSEDAQAIVERGLARGGGWLSPIEVHDLLSAVGIPVARTRFATGVDEAIR